ncbi:MAG: ATP-binding protein [Candidatus Nanopelagicales bacterium]
MIPRRLALTLRSRLAESSAVVLLGPRQVGKTTLAREIAAGWPGGSQYLDLERPADLRRLEDADSYLRAQVGLVVLDEVHRVPELFDILRGVIDERRAAGRRYGQFLLLGSASLDLLRATSDSLAGRVAMLDLPPIDPAEAAKAGVGLDQVWVRGGYPESLVRATDAASLRWREDLIRSYLERDIPMFAPRVPTETMRRLWTMLAHRSGGLLNSAAIASGLGISAQTVGRYLDLLVDLGLVRRLAPWHANVGKRLVRSPKVYLRDTGLLHALLEVPTLDALLGNPVVGPSFETLAVETLVNCAGPSYTPCFYRTAAGAELDLVLVAAGEPRIAVEIKRSSAARPTPGFAIATGDLAVSERYLVHHGTDTYQRGDGTVVVGLLELANRLAARAR